MKSLYLIPVATQAEEPSLSDDVPENNIAVFAAGGENGAGGGKAEGGGSGTVALEGCLAGSCLRVPQPDAPIRVPARNLHQTKYQSTKQTPESASEIRRELDAGREGVRAYRGGDGGGLGGGDAGDGERGGGGGGCEGDRGEAALEVPGGEAVEGGGEEQAAGGVVADVGLRRGNHPEGEGRLVAEVGLHHGGRRPPAAWGGVGWSGRAAPGVRVYGGGSKGAGGF